MDILVRFYRQHDLDLIALARHPYISMAPWIKRSLQAFARKNEGFYIPLPPPQPYSVELNSMSVHVRLNPKEDADVIACMQGFRYGLRNSAIKQILRMYLEAPYLDVYFNAETYILNSTNRTSRKDKARRFSTEISIKPTPKNGLLQEKETEHVTMPSLPEKEEDITTPISENTTDEFDLFAAVDDILHT